MTIKIKRILICKLKFYGDVLLTTPVIASLKQRYPHADIDMLLYKDTKAILAADPRINEFYLIEKKVSLLKKVRNFLSVLRQLKKNNYDLVINLTEQWPVGYLVHSLQRYSIAFEREKAAWNKLFTKVVPSHGIHIVEQNLSILQAINIQGKDNIKELSLFYTEDDRRSLLKLAPNINDKNYVVIQPTARQAFKCWDDDKFALVIDDLGQRGLEVILTCGPIESELEQVSRIAQLCVHKPDLRFAGKTSFLQLAALIDGAILYIGVDSAPMHMAAALNKPQICLFGATNPKQWRPWSDKAVLIWAGDYHKMPERSELDRSRTYLSWIPAKDVIKAVDVLLDNKKEDNNDK
ncbi:lipopolysaccharide core heptosyltransferase RfaQ [Enterobacteriaceae bacterium YMB-R22]|uniref:lipopolysaccharide core heptosyltransferase RfaQ n=1 Tax=Tenebrionicola larvae TaxID=2815733 RepID=UPI002012F749|nr:lipopolysaccharide core heptosyltransferase RfaQ [Tenebrionicola larvae]MBV4414257.1 lipopolysaccharide core heptosyltransferase RfaQ [Tenebrionicola larvae]